MEKLVTLDLGKVIPEITVFKKIQRKSGGTCDYYIDGKNIILHPGRLFVCAEALLNVAYSVEATHVGGEVASALPLIGSILTMSHMRKKELHGYIVRETVKPHGIHNLVEGQISSESRLLVIDDIVGMGSVALRCCQLLRAMGWTVVGFCAVIDRNEGARNKIEAEGFLFHALYTINGS